MHQDHKLKYHVPNLHSRILPLDAGSEILGGASDSGHAGDAFPLDNVSSYLLL